MLLLWLLCTCLSLGGSRSRMRRDSKTGADNNPCRPEIGTARFSVSPASTMLLRNCPSETPKTRVAWAVDSSYRAFEFSMPEDHAF